MTLIAILKGNCGEETAKKFQITRKEQDEYGKMVKLQLKLKLF